MSNKIFNFLFWAITLTACSKKSIYIESIYQQSHAPTEKSNIIHTTYLIGDAGDNPAYSKNNFELLKQALLENNSDRSSVVFLGDNIYPSGLHEKDHPLRTQDEERIQAQIDLLSDFKGEILFIPGNHDWAKGKSEGFESIKRQEDYIQERLGKVFVPSDGCSGPKVIEISDQLSIIAIDTQWWLHQYKKGRGEKDDCDFSTKEDFLWELKDVLRKNRHKHVIVVGHHPLYSNGEHGGYFSFSDHLFPLQNLNPKWWIPLPVLGSIYPLYRSSFGNIQDIVHPVYQDLKKELIAEMSNYDNIIYAAGHEHNLQYFLEENIHYIVSGSGSKVTKLKFNKKLNFGAMHRGFAKVEFYKNGDAYLSYISADIPKGEDSLIFKTKLYNKTVKQFDVSDAHRKNSYKNMFDTLVAEPNFKAGKFKRLFFGDLYRDLWASPVTVPVLDIHSKFGGLTPVERGGGFQTISLKLDGADGREYKLRGVRKSATFLVRKDLRQTLAQDIIYDGIAGNHPYAALAVPKISEAAQIYYTKPELVSIPGDSILGDYMDEFAGMLAIMEIHPDDDLENIENLGNSSEIIDYAEAIENLQKKHNHQVDLPFLIRSRLVDILIGDWDRHDDQWRWATYKMDDKVIYRPIPRDRDEVFFRFDGVIMSIVNRKWLMRKFQPFKKEIRDMSGLNFNARYFDRDFLSGLEFDEWINQAYFLKQQLSDSILLEALKEMPKEAFEFNGMELFETLKYRRDKLPEFAKRYYKILAKEVSVNGTIKKDYFEVIRMENGDVEVNIYPRKDGKKVAEERFFHRLFKHDETKEIRLYGLGDKDEFDISGEAKRSILVRIIANEEKDRIKDNSAVKGLGKKTIVYEVEGEQNIDMSKETKLIEKPIDQRIFYDRREFVFDQLLPLPAIGFNPDDGFVLGGGFKFTKQGFKKKPYKYTHTLLINRTFRAEGVNLFYENDYIEAFGKYDFGSSIIFNQPNVFQFFGLGNETEAINRKAGDSEIRLNNNAYRINVSRSSEDLSRRLTLFTEYQFVELEESSFTKDNEAVKNLIERNDEFFTYGINYLNQNLNDRLNPSRGISFNASISNTFSTNTSAVNFLKINSSLALFFPLHIGKKQTAIAMRVGYDDLIGDFNFYQANFLGGLEQMRGLTRNRFAGEKVVYTNIELRKSLLKVPNYVIPFDLGLLTHVDVGRVWVDDLSGNKIHRSVGGGFFFTVLDYFSVVSTFSVSDDDEVVFVGTSFYF